jgi:hypothetical protein
MVIGAQQMPGYPFQRGNNKAAKLTGEQVIAIRERYATERGLSQPMLAREYEVSVNTIAKVLSGTSWQWLLRGQEPQVYRPPLNAPAAPIPDEATLNARMQARLDSDAQAAAERKAASRSLYNDPPPTEAEDAEAGRLGLARLAKELDGPQPIKQQQVSDGLDELEKGKGDS